MNNKDLTSFIIFLFLSLSAFSQKIKILQETYLEAEYFLMKKDYQDALTYYLQLYEKMSNNANLAYKVGSCYLNIPGKKNLSIPYLETASKNMSSKYKEGMIKQITAPYDALYDLAKAYLINYNFNKAKETFQKYSELLLPDDQENLDFVKHEMQVCDDAKLLISRPVSFKEENIGELFNDGKPNFNPVISADGKTFAYMVSLKFYDAIMLSRFINGKWTAPLNITPELQVDGDIYISCLSNEGNMLYFSKYDNNNSDIYTSNFDGSRWTPAVKLGKNINTKYWESHGFVSKDGSQLVFASDRPDGFGGLDIYISLKVNGEWGPAKNLGPVINTRYNEDGPCLVNNGKTLFFISQGHQNMGGYDIFRSDQLSDKTWGNPQNIGYPLNTPDDNMFFMPAEDGKSGYYSIFRESDGFGNEDIYKITLK
jgi:tetratricopeptide (TPR) repeat protein